MFWRSSLLRKRAETVVSYDDVARAQVAPDPATNSRSLRRLLKGTDSPQGQSVYLGTHFSFIRYRDLLHGSGNIAQLVELEWRQPDPEHPSKPGRRCVLLCNTHLISERTVPDVKLFQAHSLLQVSLPPALYPSVYLSGCLTHSPVAVGDH